MCHKCAFQSIIHLTLKMLPFCLNHALLKLCHNQLFQDFHPGHLGSLRSCFYWQQSRKHDLSHVFRGEKPSRIYWEAFQCSRKGLSQEIHKFHHLLQNLSQISKFSLVTVFFPSFFSRDFQNKQRENSRDISVQSLNQTEWTEKFQT